MTDWQKIKAEFIAGATLKELSEKYQVKFATIQQRHHRGKWSDERHKNVIKTSEKIQEKISEQKAEAAVEEADRIQKIIDVIEDSIINVKANSKEGLLRALAELYKVKGTYTGKTVQKQETKHEGMNFAEAVKEILEARN